METKVIGIAGVARVGKDTFCSHLLHIFESHGFKSKRIAFADSLKEDINAFLLAKTGVNAYTIDKKEKELLRPLMVEYGRLMRMITGGLYWIEKIEKIVEKNAEKDIISVISDVRYKNEAQWINGMDGGITLHLMREGIKAANEEELRHDPFTQKACSYSVQWNTDQESALKSQTLKHINGLRLLKEPIRL